MKKSLKDAVNLIIKMADSDFDVPRVGQGTSNLGIENKSRPNLGGGGGVPMPKEVTGPIKDMQVAIRDFADTVTSQVITRQTALNSQAQVDDKKKPFNDFITENYMAKSKIKGQEYSNNGKDVNKQDKKPTDLLELDLVLDGLKRIGYVKDEMKYDNYWQFRTNNALKNIYAFAYALVNLSKDFGRTDDKSFNDNDLNAMYKLIPTDDEELKVLSNSDKISRAKALTPLIKKIKDFYNYYVHVIANQPFFRRFISKNEPMINLQKGSEDPAKLTDEQKNMLPKINEMSIGDNIIPNITKTNPIDIPNLKNFNINNMNLFVLQNEENFKRYMFDVLGYDPNSFNEKKNEVLQAILNHINKVLESVPKKISNSTAK